MRLVFQFLFLNLVEAPPISHGLTFFVTYNDMSLYLRNLIFTILQPGVVCGLIPWLIVRDEIREDLSVPFQVYHLIGTLIIVIGVMVLIHCIFSFAKHGKGTLSPLDPTKKLVAKGLYRYSRNPMYLGVLLIIIGETVILRSFNMGIYLFLVLIAFFCYVIFFEEPRLNRDFGDDYKAYKKKVRRWL